MRKVLFLRKKVKGENSMEELAYNLVREMKDIELLVLPGYNTKLLGMIQNIIFAIKHQGEINHIFSISDAYIAPFLKGKVIVTCHDMNTLNSYRIYGRIIAWLFWVYIPSLFWDICTCISNEVKTELIKKVPWRKKTIKVIYNFYNPDICFSPNIRKNQVPHILHIGTAKRKNLTNVIKALKNIDCKLIIVGKMFPEQEKALQECQTKYENYIDISFDEIIGYYKRSDIVSFPSSYEGFGVPLIEANAVGRAVVAGDIPVLREVGNDAAIYVNPHNLCELREAFISLLENESLKQSLVSKGLINAKRFNIKRVAKQYSQLYESK